MVSQAVAQLSVAGVVAAAPYAAISLASSDVRFE
jgi:hypothetical protein